MIAIRQVSKSFGAVQALDSVAFELEDSETLAIVGPSGSGKTTLLRLIAGLDLPTEGEIYIDNALVSKSDWALDPHRRNIGYVFQMPALWPHMTVLQNIRFGLHGMSKKEAHQRLDFLLGKMSLEGLERRFPHQISVGEARRVAIARSLAPGPKYILMDEPMVNLDMQNKNRLLRFILDYVTEKKASLIYVSHEPDEAVQSATRILRFKGGRIDSSSSEAG